MPQAHGSASAMHKGLSTSKRRSLAEEAAQQQLAGRKLLPGNPVVLPVLGSQALFVVLECRSAAGACSTSNCEPLAIGKDTAVKVLLGAELPPQLPPAELPSSEQVMILSFCNLSVCWILGISWHADARQVG